jgi:Cu/Ag efflux protein CusF
VIALAAATSVSGQEQTHAGLGTVQTLDRARSEVSLNHDPISSLGWPSMTMVFQVKEDRLFDRLQAGKRVAFEFTGDGRKYTVTSVIPLADERSSSTPPSGQARHSGMGMMMGSDAMQKMMDDCMAMMKQ